MLLLLLLLLLLPSLPVLHKYGLFVQSIRTILCHHRAVGCCVSVLIKMNDVNQKSQQEEKSNHKHALHKHGAPYDIVQLVHTEKVRKNHPIPKL